MRRFFAESIPQPGETAALSPAESHHALNVLRLEQGAALQLTDGRGVYATATIIDAGGPRRNTATCRVETRNCTQPPSTRMRLFIAPPKGKLMALVVRQATELGVWRVTPVLTQRGVAKHDSKTRHDHWLREAVTALKQSGNVFLPAIQAPVVFDDALAAASTTGWYGAVPENRLAAENPCSLPTGDCALWIGPEGGFTPEEKLALQEHGYKPLVIGRWILKVETALPALLGYLMGLPSND